jgi:hypothetical protein
MSTTEILIFVGLAALIILTQVGRHTLTLPRMILPLLAVVFVGRQYLQSIPTAGNDMDFYLWCAAAGLVFGALAAAMMRVSRDVTTGQIVTEAGVGFAAVWLAVFGGRLAFAYAATHGFGPTVARFSIDHVLTAASWTPALVIMALVMVAVRTLVVGGRAFLLQTGQQRASATSISLTRW